MPPMKRAKQKLLRGQGRLPRVQDICLRGQGRLPRVQDICKVCNVDPDKLFRPGVCAKGTLFGTCFASCPRAHIQISDDEAKSAIAKLQPVLSNPSLLQTNKLSEQIEIIPRFSRSTPNNKLPDKHTNLHPTHKLSISTNITSQIMPTTNNKKRTMDTASKTQDKQIPTSIPLKEDIGKSGLMWPRGVAKKHKASIILDQYNTNGCPVNIGEAWSLTHILQALKRGPHKSAKEPVPAKVLQEETLEKVNEGYAKIVKSKNIMHNVPKNLKISPVAMILHKSCLFRAILDLSFQLKVNGTKLPSVNIATVIQAPQKAMAQLGTVLKRIIYKMGTNYDPSTPFMFSKVDIKDGFWRLMVNEADAWNFCYVLPPINGTTTLEDIEIVVPNALQMGWCESPPLFCAATETAQDIIQSLAESSDQMPQHNLENYLLPQVPIMKCTPKAHYETAMEVYVDDFIGITNNLSQENLEKWSRAMLHGIHSIFPPPEITGHKGVDAM